MSEQQLYRHLSEVLEQAVPDSTNLWPRIRRQMATSRPARRPIPRIAWALAVSLAVALALAVGAVSGVVALSPVEQAAGVVYGMDDVYKAGLYTEINQSQQVGEIIVTISWVYADPNLVLIAYSQEGVTVPGYVSGVRRTSVIEASGIELTDVGGSGFDSFTIGMYQVPPELRAADELHLRLTFEGTRRPVPATPSVIPTTSPETRTGSPASVFLEPTIMAPPEVIGTAAFDLIVPVTPGRTIEVGQEVQAKGLNVAVERIVLAPSSVYADVCFDVPDATNYEWFIWGELSTGFKTVDGFAGEITSGETRLCQSILFPDQLRMDAAHYTLRMREIVGFPLDDPESNEQWRIAGPWVFRIDAGEWTGQEPLP